MCIRDRFGSDDLKRRFLTPAIAGDLVAAIGLHRFDFFVTLDGFLNGLEVGEQAAEPALVDVKLIAAQRFFLDRIAGLRPFEVPSDHHPGLPNLSLIHI